MSQQYKIGIVAILLIAMMVLPAVACTEQNRDKNSDINIDVNTVNKVTNNNVNNNVNNNNVNVNDNQNQEQNQNQNQQQDQSQSQSNIQIVNIPATASPSNQFSSITQLDVGESQEFSRLVYPGEVIPFNVSSGDKISVKASSDITFYTIGTFSGDEIRINDVNSIPVYNPVYHRMEFGTVVPVDVVGYWTTKASLTASSNAQYVVIDNRAPMNGYTHIEVVISNAGQDNKGT
jgi:hypothetical protein